jgi:hypothetical protein
VLCGLSQKTTQEHLLLQIMCLLSILVGNGASLITDGVILRDWTNMAFGCGDQSGQQALEGHDTSRILLLIDDWI